MPGMPMTLVPAKGSSEPKGWLRARALPLAIVLVEAVLVLAGLTSPAS